MLLFIGGFMVGCLVGFFLCGILHINRFTRQQSILHAHPHERRINHTARFPLTDCDGILVNADRRMQPDRRSYGISHST